jgi:8-oxo-dGTP pyrophosphatase MutT (NUDIX family)
MTMSNSHSRAAAVTATHPEKPDAAAPERFASIIDVHVILRRAGRLLLLRRAGDVYASGQLCLPSGHLEQGESVCQAAAREAFEETGIMLGPAALRHVLSIHQRNRGTPDTRVGFVFAPCAWTGEPVNAEPHKHSELIWAIPSALPADTAEYTAAVITAAERGLAFTLNGW